MTVGSAVTWSKALKKKELAELATVLAGHSVTVWNKFHQHSSCKPELKTLPGKALKEIELSLSDNSTHKLKEYFTSFVTPVVHILDGYIKFPYEVKLAFLSVFQILHGLVATNNPNAAKEAFSSSISKSLDAITIAGVLSPDELAVIIKKYNPAK